MDQLEKGKDMSYVLQYDVPADEQFYRRVREELGDEQPKGLIVHMVLKREGGLRHLGVWESKEDWERFRDERAEPALARVFQASGFPRRPPRPEVLEMGLVDVWMG